MTDRFRLQQATTPFDRNGLKFFCTVSDTRVSGGLEGAEIEEILQFAQDGDFITGDAAGRLRKPTTCRSMPPSCAAGSVTRSVRQSRNSR